MGVENLATDHLSHFQNPHVEQLEEDSINNAFPKEHLYNFKEVIESEIPWFIDFANYLATRILPKGLSYQQKKKLFFDLKDCLWGDPCLFKTCVDQVKVIRRYDPQSKAWKILRHYHFSPIKRHYHANKTAQKILELGFY